MPPQRTTPLARTVSPAKAASKPVKSERTHEENQERAYIAASRRSDRSLEARIESARRASEVHKKRTGKALRVTEADVVNEEMYEEVDDDVTHTYRNLGLLMGSSPMDRRAAAYYQHQIYMQSMVGKELQERVAHSGIVGGFAPNQMYLPGYTQQLRLQPQQFPFYRQPHQMQSAYRSQPYCLPAGGHSHGRAMSMHIPQNPPVRMAQPMAIQTHSPALLTPTSPEGGRPGYLRRQPAPMGSSAHLYTNEQLTPTSPENGRPGCLQQQQPGPTGSSAHFYTNGELTPYDSPPQVAQLPSPESDGENPYSLFPFTNELPGESVRFLAGQVPQANYLNMASFPTFDLFDNTTYTTSKGFATSLSPSQQNDPFESKTEDGLATATGKLKWQPSKQDSPFSNASPLSMSLLTENSDEVAINSLFAESVIPLCTSDGFYGLTELSDPADPEVWEKFMNDEWVSPAAA